MTTFSPYTISSGVPGITTRPRTQSIRTPILDIATRASLTSGVVDAYPSHRVIHIFSSFPLGVVFFFFVSIQRPQGLLFGTTHVFHHLAMAFRMGWEQKTYAHVHRVPNAHIDLPH